MCIPPIAAGFSMTRILASCALWLFIPALSASGQEFNVSKVEATAPAEAVAAEIGALLQPTGLKVTKGAQTIIEIWAAKEWPLAADAKTGGEVLYPLTPGQLVGVVRYSRKAADFRDQDIPAGTYVVRYAQQPVDGAHVGTSPTRDFLALLPAAKDRQASTLDYKTLTGTSKETSGTAHPGILSLQKAEESGGALSVRHDSDRELVIVRFIGKAKQGDSVKDLPVELVVVGKAAE
jgi:hypothetical protein